MNVVAASQMVFQLNVFMQKSGLTSGCVCEIVITVVLLLAQQKNRILILQILLSWGSKNGETACVKEKQHVKRCSWHLLQFIMEMLGLW